MTVIDVLPDIERLAPSRQWARRTAWVLLLTMAGALLGLGVATQIPRAYVAQGSLLVLPLEGNAFDQSGVNRVTDLETESHVVSSDAVLRRVAMSEDGLPSVEQMRKRLSIEVVPNAEVILLRYRGESPAQGRDLVQRIAEATLDERVARAEAVNAQRQEVIQALMDRAREDRPENQTAAQAQLFAQRMNALNAQLAEAGRPVNNPGRLITVVAKGDGRTKRLQLLVVGGFALAGLAVGLWVARAPTRRGLTHADPG